MTGKPGKYLRLIGRLHPDNRLKLRPGYITTMPRFWQHNPDGPLYAEMLGANGNLISRQGVPSAPYCFGSGMTPELAVWADIAFPEKTRIVRFFRDDVFVHEIKVPLHGPKLALSWKPKDHNHGKQTISWKASHQDDVRLQFIVRYSHNAGKSWRRLGKRLSEPEVNVDFDRLPGGPRCKIQILATDGVNTRIVNSNVFSVPKKGCIVTILQPPDGSRFNEGETIILRGTGFHVERLEPVDEDLFWESDRDGRLGRGPVLPIGKLSTGKHNIALHTEVGSDAARAFVTVQIRTAKRGRKSD